MRERIDARLRPLAALLAIGATLAVPAGVQAADRVYWANFGAPERISFANLDGGGGTDLQTAGALLKVPIGLALDPFGGRAYWSNQSGPGGISYANLDGSGGAGNLNTGAAPVKGPSGAAIDPIGRRIYWGNVGEGTIGWANLDGSGGGALNTGSADVSAPYALAVDPSGGRVYWTNSVKAGVISWAKLDGSGGEDLSVSGSATLEYPLGLAIGGGRIYWANDLVAGRISYALLESDALEVKGVESADLNTAGATVSEPYGVAVDPYRNRVYWANSSGGLAYADTFGQGGANLSIGGGFASGAPNFPNLLDAPSGAAPPRIFGSAKPGTELTCNTGFWALDLPSASYYRSPAEFAYRWTRNGAPIDGATAPSLTAEAVGEYNCVVTGVNAAGSGAQTSAVAPIFRIGKLRRNRRKGTARLATRVPGRGALRVTGRHFRNLTRSGRSARVVKITIRAQGRALRQLRRKGRAKLALVFSYLTPTPGAFYAVQKRSVVLRMKK